MEILKQSAGFYSEQANGAQSVADIAQSITASRQQHLALADAAETERLWKKKQPGAEGEAGPNGVVSRPTEESGAPRDGPPGLRQVNLQGRPGRAGQRDAQVSSETSVANHRVKTVTARDTAASIRDVLLPAGNQNKAGPIDRAAGALPDTSGADKTVEITKSADGAEKAMSDDSLSAGVISQGRPASELPQIKAPEQPAHERQHMPHSSSAELKQHATERNSVLTYTFSKAKAGRKSAVANSVQILFKGATVMMPSNRNTYDNLLAHQSHGQDYLILPDPEQQQHRQQRDNQPEDEQ